MNAFGTAIGGRPLVDGGPDQPLRPSEARRNVCFRSLEDPLPAPWTFDLLPHADIQFMNWNQLAYRRKQLRETTAQIKGGV
jgi:hypothetical protein